MRRYGAATLVVTLLLSVAPLAAQVVFVAVPLISWLRGGPQITEVSPEIGGAIIVGIVVLPLLLLTLIGWYSFPIVRDVHDDISARLSWIVALVCLNAAAFPVYWYRFILNASPSQPRAPSARPGK